MARVVDLGGGCEAGDVVFRVEGGKHGFRDLVEPEVTAGSRSHQEYQDVGAVVVGFVVVVGFGFSCSLVFGFRNLSGFHEVLLVLRASRSGVDRVWISVAPKLARGSPRAAGVTRSKEVGGQGT